MVLSALRQPCPQLHLVFVWAERLCFPASLTGGCGHVAEIRTRTYEWKWCASFTGPSPRKSPHEHSSIHLLLPCWQKWVWPQVNLGSYMLKREYIHSDWFPGTVQRRLLEYYSTVKRALTVYVMYELFYVLEPICDNFLSAQSNAEIGIESMRLCIGALE